MLQCAVGGPNMSVRTLDVEICAYGSMGLHRWINEEDGDMVLRKPELLIQEHVVVGYWIGFIPYMSGMLLAGLLGVCSFWLFLAEGGWLWGLSWRDLDRRPYRHFIVFDRQSGLVHVPQRWGRKLERLRFADASFVLTERYGSYTSTDTHLHLVRPGHDLIHDGFPGRWRVTDLCGGFGDEIWSFIVAYMQGKRHVVEDMTVQRAARHSPRFSRFDSSRLPTEPTFVREADGAMRRVRPAVDPRTLPVSSTPQSRSARGKGRRRRQRSAGAQVQ